jgi:hypothetical protein
MMKYVVHPPALAPRLAEYLREHGYDASNEGQRLFASYPAAADPTEERLMLGGVIAAWRRANADARVDLV